MKQNIVEFLRRYWLFIILVVVAFGAVAGLAGAFENFQIGLNPLEFLVKIPAKVMFLAVAWLATLFVVKYGFPTVATFCRKPDATTKSPFTVAFESNPQNPLIWYAIATHIGVFIGVSLVMALAF